MSARITSTTTTFGRCGDELPSASQVTRSCQHPVRDTFDQTGFDLIAGFAEFVDQPAARRSVVGIRVRRPGR